jgi:hypothetical protein
MSDFIVPYPPLRDRRSAPNGFGFRTILGNASPLSAQWDYARERAAESDDTGRRGAASNVEPPPDSPEYQNAFLQALGNEAGARPQPSAASAAVGALSVADRAEWEIGKWLAGLAARAAPAAVAAAPPVALAVPLVAIPKSVFDDQTLRLGDRFRASQPPGQKSVILERRVDDGLLGTGVGAKWEQLPPLDATLRVGQYGLKTLVADADQLRDTLGADAAKQLFATGLVIDRRADEADAVHRARTASGDQGDLAPPLTLPTKIEMRIWASTDRGTTTSAREATREQVEQVCPNFSKYEQYAMEAAAKYKAAGLPNGMEYGRLVHQDVEKRLRAAGIPEIRPELAVREGKSPSFSKGSSRIDIVELHKDHITICVYELKTGGARIPREVAERYSREAGMYWKLLGQGYPNVYFIPIRVP